MCKKIAFNLFEFKDANLIERFAADIFEEGETDDDPDIEKASIYGDKGKILRRKLFCYTAAGDLTDEPFRELAGKVPGEFEYKPFDVRVVEGQAEKVRRTSVVIGTKTAFTNQDINSPFFSAYRTDIGELKLWFMGRSAAGETLQCHFSSDDGQNWYDLWEAVENRFNRLRFDPEKKTQFVDRNADGTVTVAGSDLEGEDPEDADQEYPFGINVHWSRLRRHKLEPDEGEVTLDTESQVLAISSPYVFYQPRDKRVFLFYIYENCLLCKMFDESLLSRESTLAAEPEDSGMQAVKHVLERITKAHFIDGALKGNTNLHSEIHGFFNEDTDEIIDQSNIIFRYPYAVDSFTDDRAIAPQRVCAYELPAGGLIRVFYKHTGSVKLKSALWTGKEWWAEDFMVRSSEVEEFDLAEHIHEDADRVLGGFGSEAFGVV